MPVIASLNGHSPGGWTRYARMLEDAGADALELNIYFVPTDCGMDGSEVEQRYVDLVAAVQQSVKIPLAVKIGSQFSSIPNIAFRLMTAGRRRAGAVQSLSGAGHRPGNAANRARSGAQPAARGAVAAALDRDPARSIAVLAGGDERHSRRGERDPRAAGRAPTWR